MTPTLFQRLCDDIEPINKIFMTVMLLFVKFHLLQTHNIILNKQAATSKYFRVVILVWYSTKKFSTKICRYNRISHYQVRRIVSDQN
jgi:hypothetical protein